MLRRLALAIILALGAASAAGAQEARWQVCFTPGQDCTGVVIAAIAGAQKQILVQAYSFTSTAAASMSR